jgi:hypothetical protein
VKVLISQDVMLDPVMDAAQPVGGSAAPDCKEPCVRDYVQLARGLEGANRETRATEQPDQLS